MIVRILLLDLLDKSPVDLLHDLIDSGQQSGEQLDGPFFQRFRHDRVVRISAGLRGHFPRLFPGQIIVVHQHAHQFRDGYRGMGIVELEGHLLMEFADIRMLLHVLRHGRLYGRGNEEILLL